MASHDLGDAQHAVARIDPLDNAKNPAPVEAGSTVWAVSDATLATVTPIDDNSATVQALGPLGTFELTVTADADLGDGVTNISDAATINVIAGPATNLGLSLGTPEDNAPVP